MSDIDVCDRVHLAMLRHPGGQSGTTTCLEGLPGAVEVWHKPFAGALSKPVWSIKRWAGPGDLRGRIDVTGWDRLGDAGRAVLAAIEAEPMPEEAA